MPKAKKRQKKAKKKAARKARKKAKPKAKGSSKDLSKISKCPACGSENVVYVVKDDNIVCNECGEIFVKLTPEEEKKYEKVSDTI